MLIRRPSPRAPDRPSTISPRRCGACRWKERGAVAGELRARHGADPSDSGLRESRCGSSRPQVRGRRAHLRHHYLPELDDALGTALVEGRDRLAAVAGCEVRTIVYQHAERIDAWERPRRAGYTAGFTTHPEVVLPGDDPLLLGRLEPPLRSAGRFAARLLLALTRRTSRVGHD